MGISSPELGADDVVRIKDDRTSGTHWQEVARRPPTPRVSHIKVVRFKAHRPAPQTVDQAQYATLKSLVFRVRLDPDAEALLAPARQRLDELARLVPDWSPRGSKAPTLPALMSAHALLVLAVGDIDIPDQALIAPYYISPVVNGGISYSWRSDWAQLWVTISPNGGYRYYWEDRNDSTVFEEQADVIPSAVLQQLEKTLRSPSERP